MNNLSEAFSEYISGITNKFNHEATSEYGYRTEFEILMKQIFQEIGVKRIDHDAKSFKGNKPDYVIFTEVPILYIEVKDIGVSLDKIEKSEQMSRYFGYDNLVLSDYVEFRFYRNGERYEEPIKIAEYDKKGRTITPLPQNYEHLANTLVDFTKSHKEPIKSGLQLAKIMGGKGRRIRDNVLDIFESKGRDDSSLQKVFEVFKSQLIHDLDTNQFADMYAQTLVYGLFVARFHDESPENFSRQEARDLVPASNPLLRHFFDHIVGPDFNKSLEYIVNELCEVYSHSDIEKLMGNYYKIKKDEIKEEDKYKEQDPVIHFYEDFLKEYDPALRKKMGAYYTPLPVVRFIIRAVDDILQKEFGLDGGIASTEKLPDGQHKVQILDPATGTGTFLTELINEIYKKFKGQEGAWPAYVHHELLPRIFGFELMMAPYTIAHLKMSMQLKSMGFKYFNNTRLGIYLTNALENEKDTPSLFGSGFGLSESISEESKEAHKIKNEKPIMVVIGNPPYSVSSSNKGKYIEDLMQEYKKDLNERNIQPLSDDYIKFIRFSQNLIEQNGEGIVAMITNNSFIDGIIHRQMRKSLTETFDKIYVIDLHGNSSKGDKSPDGTIDQNVFDIQQGVSISLFIKNKQNANTKFFRADLFGTREKKFEELGNPLNEIDWQSIKPDKEYLAFIDSDDKLKEEYSIGFSISDIFEVGASGVKTHDDKNLVSIDPFDTNTNARYLYRPFDEQFIDYNLEKVERHRYTVMQHMQQDNLALATTRQFVEDVTFNHILVTNKITDIRITTSNRGSAYIYPLYKYVDNKRIENFTDEFRKFLNKQIDAEIDPEGVLDYILAVLHSNSYRTRYNEFLKIDFPRIPFTSNKDLFWKLVEKGRELREYHLMEHENSNKLITSFPEAGDNAVTKAMSSAQPGWVPNDTLRQAQGDKKEVRGNRLGKVWINDTQYFDNVPEVAWNFYIGGYQPAQKWLKDRKKAERKLSFEDIKHYQKIIVALVNTDRIMKEIDGVIPEWPLK